MELLVLLLVGLLIAIVILPFVALVKANSAKRSIDGLATRLSSLEDEVHGLRRQSISVPEPEAVAAVAKVVQPPFPVTTPSPVLQEEKSVPPPVPKTFIEATVPQITKPAKPPINWEQFMGAKLFAWIGGLALFLGVAFFVKYSFEHNLISPELRVAIGFVVGASLVIGGLLLKRKERRHCADALRDRNPGALCRDVCLSRLLSLRILRSHSNVFIDDGDHGDGVSARRPVECDGRRCAGDRRRLSHACIAFDRRRLSSRPLRLYRVARCRSPLCCATTTMECARDSRRTRNSVDAVRLDHHVLYPRKIFCRQQSPCCHGGACGISRAVSCSGSMGKANREDEP